ncbi:MAG: SPOR domain-containing protein [Marinicellaceae bacterium]
MATKKKTTKKKTRRKAGRPAAKQKLPGWIILLIGMLFGLSIAVFGYVSGWVPKPKNIDEKPIAQSSQSTDKNSIEDKSEDLVITKPQKQYDFYTTLQEMEVVIDETELSQSDPRTAKSFTIQLGAFKNLSDAESLKAQVAFIGQTAYIQPIVDGNNTQWHRVRIGPFDSGRKAGVVIKNLDKNGFNSIIIKNK